MEMNVNEKDEPISELKELYTAKKYEECMKMCKEVLAKNQLNLQALLYMADINLELRNPEEVLHYCDTIIRAMENKMYYVWQMRGQALCLLKRYDEARKSFGEALGLIAKDDVNEGVFLWSLYAFASFISGEKERAFNLLDALEEELGWQGKFALIRGFMERVDGNTTEALTQFIEGSMAVEPTSKDYEESKEVFAREVFKTLKN
jgi:tetratricopeptide (TPR) repeat protein